MYENMKMEMRGEVKDGIKCSILNRQRQMREYRKLTLSRCLCFTMHQQ